MKFDINIDYAIDLDKCNEQALPEGFKVKSEVQEKQKLRIIRLNFLMDYKMLVFIENDTEMREFKSLMRKQNKITQINENEYLVNNERDLFYKDLLKRLKDKENQNSVILRTFNYRYFNNVKVAQNSNDNNLINRNRFEALKRIIFNIYKLFFEAEVHPNFIGEILEDDGSCNFYSEISLFSEETRELKNLPNISKYLTKITPEVFKSLFWNEFPFNDISIALNDFDSINVKIFGFDLNRAFDWIQNSYVGSKICLTNFPIPQSIISSVSESSNLVLASDSNGIKFYGFKLHVEEFKKLLSK
jgi:hypothetical protein